MWLASPAGTHWDVCLPVTRHDVVYHLLLIHELFADSALKINHALWSIAVEWKIYFLFPLLLAGFRRFGEVTATVLAIAAGYLAWVVCVVFDVMNPGPWGASFYYVGLFTLGMFAAVRSPRPTRVSSDDTSARSDRAWTTALVAASIGVVAVSVRHVVPWQIRSLFVGVWASVLFVALSRDLAPSWLARLLTLRPTVWLGREGLQHLPRACAGARARLSARRAHVGSVDAVARTGDGRYVADRDRSRRAAVLQARGGAVPSPQPDARNARRNAWSTSRDRAASNRNVADAST